MSDGDANTGRVEVTAQPENPPIPLISAGDWETAADDPAVKAFVQQAIAEERRLEREGLIFP
jgi:hypothetical protein